MSERIFGTEKVDNIIGLKDQKVYDKIEIYVDVNNNNNVWSMLYYTEYKNHKPIQRQEILRFSNYQSMMDYLHNNFDCYELNHPIDYQKKKIFFHNVDYCDIEYFCYEGKPEYNYIVIKVFEFVNNTHELRKIELPKEFEELFKDILRVNKNLPPDARLDSRYFRDVDVYDQRASERKEIIRSIKMSIEEFFVFAGDKIRRIKEHKKGIIRGLKLAVPLATIATILTTGVNLISNHNYNSSFMVQKNAIRNAQDIGIYFNKGKAGAIIENLFEGKYQDVSPDEVREVIEFIRNVDSNNYDGNDSFNTFSYSEYFRDVAYRDGMDMETTTKMLEKLERLYKNSVVMINGKPSINRENAKKFIDYVCSLSFMYDTYHTDRVKSYVTTNNNQDLISSYANSDEIAAFDKFPPILRFIILTQCKGLMQRTPYEVDRRPTYYFGSTDKYDLLSKLSGEIDKVIDKMYFECGYSNGNKTI